MTVEKHAKVRARGAEQSVRVGFVETELRRNCSAPVDA
jgi:hypothetical protein